MTTSNHCNSLTCPLRRRRRPWFAVSWCCALLLSTAVMVASKFHTLSRESLWSHPDSLAKLLALSPVRLAEVPLLEVNLLCARGLCPTNEPDLQAYAATLEVWVARVRSETERHQYRYQQNPAEFENSPGFFRMLMLAAVLTEDYGVHYDPRRRAGPESTRIDDGFFADPRTIFLHGLLGADRVGTCSSLPVLYVAVGRQLGYPLKLVTTKGHLFVRWEGDGERFNVEVTGHGLNRFDDEYYRHWPFEISRAEERPEGYLKSLTPAEELGVFLSVRGMCLREAGRLAEAAESFAAAVRLSPCRSYQTMQAGLKAALPRQTASTMPSPSPNSTNQNNQE